MYPAWGEIRATGFLSEVISDKMKLELEELTGNKGTVGWAELAITGISGDNASYEIISPITVSL
ncbi:hypothetical protein KKF29_00350, partial [Patescibacteria group bacterium]|nr:hypothetical protein [Patescibacteria group bacterium]